MENKLLDNYTVEKDIFKKLLIGSRMVEVSYNETFNLLFLQSLDNDKYKKVQLLLIIDAPCWLGNRDEWMARIKNLEKNNTINEREDCLLAYELIRLRYNNLIQVEKADFLDDCLAIKFEEENILSIAYDAESDYTWTLEEFSSKIEQDRMVIGCQGNELFQNNIPEFLHSL